MNLIFIIFYYNSIATPLLPQGVVDHSKGSRGWFHFLLILFSFLSFVQIFVIFSFVLKLFHCKFVQSLLFLFMFLHSYVYFMSSILLHIHLLLFCSFAIIFDGMLIILSLIENNVLCTTHTNSMSSISQLFLTQFLSNFKGGLVGSTTTITTRT